MPAPHDQPRWPATIPWRERGPAPGRWRSRGDATAWTDLLYQRIAGIPDWADRRKLARIALGRPRRWTSRTEGAIAQTEILEYPDGTHAVRKTFGDTYRPRRERVASLVAEAIGAPAPAVVSDPTNPEYAVIMGYVPGDPGTVHTGQASLEDVGHALYYLAQTDSGLRIGLLDVLVGNEDRHSDNWRLSSELPEPNLVGVSDGDLRRPVAIDHSEVFSPSAAIAAGQKIRGEDGQWYDPPVDYGSYEGFMGAWLREAALDQRNDDQLPISDPGLRVRLAAIPIFTYRRNPLHPDDVPVLRARLEALRDEFEQEEMLGAYRAMMDRFEAVAAHASGAERMFPDG